MSNENINSECNLAIFASGTGSNFINIYNNTTSGEILGKVKLLISNNPRCKAIEFAKENNISYEIINKSRFPDSGHVEKTILQVLDNNNIDLIILAGYMKKIPKGVIEKYNNRIMNIHPALLPKFGGKGFYGMNVHEAVINSNEKKTGITIHFVDSEYDTGNVIYQEEIEVMEEDSALTLAKRVLELEHKSYPKIVKEFCNKHNRS